MGEHVYGVWNSITKRFVYGIRESSEKRARAALRKATGGWRCYRYDVRRIPEGYENPINETAQLRYGKQGGPR